ncbi:MAG: hypothetical protein KKA61_03935 [Nanoarchaeota archaeon]|nr:hypothetical protein [Nanoarchaeota archaeon]MBU4493494.1 hypothetical protein [Nanoarchaeota archaeon]
MELKVNWEHKRVKHAIERMWLRGINRKDIISAIKKGQKRKQKKNQLTESLYSYYSVIYDEYFYKKQDIHKVYPITVKIW